MNISAAQIPTPALLAARYREPRTLRTRATGTPFRVVWRAGSLVVIPGSGVERTVLPDELRRVWPMIAAGATRTALKGVSNNSSYLDAVFDDMQALDRLEPTELAVSPARRPADGQAGRLLISANQEIQRPRDSLQAERSRASALERDLSTGSSSADTLEKTVRRLRGDLLQANLQERELSSKLDQAREQIKLLESRRSRDESRQLSLTIGEHTFDSRHQIRADLWEILYEAGQLAFKFPSGSVASSRRALEAAVGYLWRQATGGTGTPKVADMLDELRGHRLVPISDWHLAKNIYGRASAIVHDGTKRPDQALWIFFGALQICELVQSDEPAA